MKKKLEFVSYLENMETLIYNSGKTKNFKKYKSYMYLESKINNKPFISALIFMISKIFTKKILQ